MKRTTLLHSVMGLGMLLAGFVPDGEASSEGTKAGRPAARLVFNEKGEGALPKGYRSWVHTYTTWESITTTILDGTVTKTPEFHSVYVEPTAYRAFMETGKWPEGSLMVKEFNTTSIDPKNCDGPPAYPCKFGSSTVIFPHGYTGIGVMLKDSKRYPGEPGGWVYFSYGHRAPPYEPFSPVRDRAQCAQCHIDHVGPKNDYVFSVELNQPGFTRAGADVANNLAAAFPD